MKKLWSKMTAIIMSVFLMVLPLAGNFLVMGPVFAEGEESGGGVETSILDPNWANGEAGMKEMFKFFLNFVIYGLGAAAVLGLVIVGIQYMTARDNEAQMTKAKTRMIEIAIGLLAWGVMYAALNFLIPGGLQL